MKLAAPLLILTVLLAMVAAPFYLLHALWQKRDEEPFQWLVATLYTGAFLLFLFLVGPWDWVSYAWRYVWGGAYLAVVGLSVRRVWSKPFRFQGGWQVWSDLAALAFFLALVLVALWGGTYSGEPVELAFPLAGGRYAVGQGGNNFLINAHQSSEPQRYALDIVALNGLLTRASGLYPSAVERYAIFGRTVVSPCDGVVTKTVDGLPDEPLPGKDRQPAAGNHVIIACHGVNVILAHLQEGSLVVRVGDVVETGQPLGRVGNSGNSTEPHLHIHAVREAAPGSADGEPVPILFNGRFPVRNTIVVP